MADSIFVTPDDGCTLAGDLPGVPGLYPPVKFKYRPCPPGVRLRYTEVGGAAAKLAAGAEIIAERITEVRAGDDPNPVALKPEQAKLLHADIFQGLLFAALGFTTPKVEDDAKNSATASG